MKSKIIISVVSVMLATTFADGALNQIQPTFKNLALKIDAEFEELVKPEGLVLAKMPNTMIAANLAPIASYFNPHFSPTAQILQSRFVTVYAPIKDDAQSKLLLDKIDTMLSHLADQYKAVLVLDKSQKTPMEMITTPLATYKNPNYQPGIQTLVAQPEEFHLFFIAGKHQRQGKFNILTPKP